MAGPRNIVVECWELGVVYTMDHEVVPRPCKICDWLLNLSRNHFGLHQGKNVRVIMKFEVPKRHSLRFRIFIDMVQRVLRWERQIRCSTRKRHGSMPEKYHYNQINELIIIILE